MQLIFVLVGIAGIAIFLWGSNVLMRYHNMKSIGELKDPESEISFTKAGTYAICLVGGGVVDGIGRFRVKVTGGGRALRLYEKHMKFKFRHRGVLTTEFYEFEVRVPGVYKFLLVNTEDINLKESVFVRSVFLFKNKSVKNIEFVVKESLSGVTYVVGLLMTIFGFNIAFLGMFTALNPDWFK